MNNEIAQCKQVQTVCCTYTMKILVVKLAKMTKYSGNNKLTENTLPTEGF